MASAVIVSVVIRALSAPSISTSVLQRPANLAVHAQIASTATAVAVWLAIRALNVKPISTNALRTLV
jgi:hypothetical protein